MEQLLNLDYWLFELIHIKCANGLFDFIAPFFRNQYFWVPLYVFILIVMYQRFGKEGLWWCVGFLASFALADFISASILKPMFGRVRPCVDPMWYGQIRHLVNASTSPGFPSTHASNHFALSAYMAVTLSRHFKKIALLAYIWAALVALAQVYVGVHYPLDVTCGALLGIWIGYITGNYVNLRGLLS
jgi:membrane-associated phospholipid phosphatase